MNDMDGGRAAQRNKYRGMVGGGEKARAKEHNARANVIDGGNNNNAQPSQCTTMTATHKKDTST